MLNPFGKCTKVRKRRKAFLIAPLKGKYLLKFDRFPSGLFLA
jgi:hypothetical protein